MDRIGPGGALSLSLLAGCQNNTPTGGSGAAISTPTSAPAESEGGKTLVANYSATGSTQAVAQTIASTTGSDLFEIIPAETYSSADLDWTDKTAGSARSTTPPPCGASESDVTDGVSGLKISKNHK